MTPDIWTLVPVRGIDRGKSRLGAVLDAAGRACLNRWLLAHTLEVIGRWHRDLGRCCVISPCEQVLEIARRAGALVVHEAAGADDLNRALAIGASRAAANGAGKVLVLPCDLPDLTVESLDALATESGREQHMALAPDTAGTGTNALLVDACPDVEFRFGERSYARHCEWAAARGWTVSVCARPELGFDLDTPQDLAAWLSRGHAGMPELHAKFFRRADYPRVAPVER